MSLADKLKHVTRTNTGMPCGIAKLMTTVSEEDKTALEIVFSTKSITGTISNVQLHKLLVDEGYDTSFSSIRLHRGQICRCYTGKEVRESNRIKARK